MEDGRLRFSLCLFLYHPVNTYLVLSSPSLSVARSKHSLTAHLPHAMEVGRRPGALWAAQ